MNRSIAEILAALIVIFAMVGVAFAIPLLYRTVTIPGAGSIKSVGVAFYKYANLTGNLTSINWGMVTPGYTFNYTTFCKNIKAANVTMSLAIINWNPANASLYLHPGWNYTGALLITGTAIPIKFTLQVFANATSSGISNFSFAYNVTAVG